MIENLKRWKHFIDRNTSRRGYSSFWRGLGVGSTVRTPWQDFLFFGEGWCAWDGHGWRENHEEYFEEEA